LFFLIILVRYWDPAQNLNLDDIGLTWLSNSQRFLKNKKNPKKFRYIQLARMGIGCFLSFN